MNSYLRELGHTIVKGFAIGIGLGIGAYGLMILTLWMGWLQPIVCK